MAASVRGLLDGPRTDAGRGAGRFSGRAAAVGSRLAVLRHARLAFCEGFPVHLDDLQLAGCGACAVIIHGISSYVTTHSVIERLYA